MHKVMIYPYVNRQLPIISHINKYVKDMKIVSLVALEGLINAGRDAGSIRNHTNTGLKIGDDFVSELAACDTVIFCDDEYNAKIKNSLIRDMETAFTMKKDVICMLKLTEEEREQLENNALKAGANFEYHVLKYSEQSFCYKPKKPYHINTPIIFVGEMLQDLDGTDVCLAVSGELQERGYRTVTILNKVDVYLKGTFGIPCFFTDKGITEEEKVYYMNNYISFLEMEYKPDIFIIQIPGAMMRYNDAFGNGFGIYAYLISQAVQADYFILCTQFGLVDSSFYKELSVNFQQRFGYEIDAVHMSNAMLDVQDSLQKQSLSYLYQKQERVNEALESVREKSEIPIFDGFTSEHVSKICDDIIYKLSDDQNEGVIF